MYQFLTKYGQMAAFGLGLLITLLFLFIAISGLDSYNALPDGEEGKTTIFNFGLYAVIGLIFIGIALSLIFGVIYLATHPQAAIRFGIMIGALLIIAFGLYFVSSAETTGKIAELAEQNFNSSETISKMISAGLYTVLILSGLAVLSLIVGEARNIFK